MVWRILLVLSKSALMVLLFEVLSPVAEAIGIQFSFVATMASAISHSTALPYREAEILFLFVAISSLLEVADLVWNLITG